MTKIICVGDIHVSDRPPSGATESYLPDLLDMLDYVSQLEKDLNADAVVWAGDIFHFKQPNRTSHSTVLRMIEAVKKYRNLYIVTGNHDISNDVLDSVHEKQPLGVLFAAGAKELIGWDETLPLYGVPWQQRWLHDGVPMEAFTSWRLDPWRYGEVGDTSRALAVTHAPVYPPEMQKSVMFELVPTSGPNSLAEAMGGQGFLYYGHIHEDHGVFQDGGVTFANMGALSRGSLAEYNIERSIKVALWTDGMDVGVETIPLVGKVNLKGDAKFIEVPIPHKPASEVLRVVEKREKSAEKMDLADFVSDIGSSTLDVTTVGAVTDYIRTKPGLTESIRTKAIELMEAQE